MRLIPVLPVHKLKIKWLDFMDMSLSDWESKFIRGLRDHSTISKKQEDKLNEVYEGVRHGRTPFLTTVEDIDWSDVHDFDRE